MTNPDTRDLVLPSLDATIDTLNQLSAHLTQLRALLTDDKENTHDRVPR